MRAQTLVSALLVVVVAGFSTVIAGPAAAQDPGDGAVDLTIQPSDAEVDPGAVQTFDLVVDGPDAGLIAYDEVVVEVGDSTVASITSFSGEPASADTNSEIRDDGATLFLDAAVLGYPADSAVTIATFDVAAVGDAGSSTPIAFDRTANQSLTSNFESVYTVNAFNDATLSTRQPANVSVAITGTNTPVTEGENLTVDLQVENTGDLQATQTVTLDAGALGTNSTQVTLSGGTNTTETLSLATSEDDAGTYTATVSSLNVTDSQTVTVNEKLAPPNFQVSINETVLPTSLGDLLSVTVDVENTGDRQDTQTLELDAGLLGSNTTQVTLNGGESTTETLSVLVSVLGSVTAEVSTANDTASTGVELAEPANLSVAITGTNAPVLAGETLTVDTEIENVGSLQGTQTVNLAAGALGSNSTQVTLASGANTTETLSLSTADGDAGRYTVTVSTANKSVSREVRVERPASLSVVVTETNAPVVAGETLTTDIRIENVGDLQGTQTIELDGGALGTNTTSVTLLGGASTNETLALSTADGDVGSYTLTVSSGTDTDSQSVTVREPALPANFSVSNIQPKETTVTSGAVIRISADIENVGGVQGSQDIVLTVDGVRWVQGRALTPGENATITFPSFDTGQLGPGQYTHEIDTENDSQSGTLTVEAQSTEPQPTLEFNNQSLGESGTVTVENVDNDGTDAAILLTYESGGGLVVAGVAPPPVGNGSVAVSLGDTGGFPGNHTAHVLPATSVSQPYEVGDTLSQETAANIADNETAFISQATQPAPANFSVSNIQPKETTVTSGAVIETSADIENVGGVQGSQDIVLTVDGVRWVQGRALTPGENATITFPSFDTGQLGPGEYTHEIASDNDSVSGSLTVQEEASVTFDDQATQEGNPTVNVGVDLPESGFVTVHDDNLTDDGPVQSIVGLSELVRETDTSVDVTLGRSIDSSGETLVARVYRDANENGEFDFADSGDDGDRPYVNETGTPVADSAAVSVQEPDQRIEFTNQSLGDQGEVVVENVTTDGVDSVVLVTYAADGVDIVAGIGTPSDGTVQLLDTGGVPGEHTVHIVPALRLNQTPQPGTPLSADTASAVTDSDTAFVSQATQPTPANFRVSIIGTNAPVTEGEPLNVTVTVQNTGDLQATQTVGLTAGALGSDSTQVTLASGNSTTETLTVATGGGDAGSYTATVSSVNDTDSQTVTVEEPSADPQPTLAFNNQTIDQEETVTVENVDNAGSSAAILVTYESSGESVVAGVAPLPVSNGSVAVAVADTGGVPGEHTAHILPATDASQQYEAGATLSQETAANITDAETATISTQPAPANVSVSIAETNVLVTEGEDLTVNVSVENTGDLQGTQTLRLDVGALGTDSASVTLAGGASLQETLTVGTESGDAGEYTATVASDNDTASQQVTVDAPAALQLDNLQPAEPTVTAGAGVDFSVDVQNTGGVAGTQVLTLTVGGITESRTVTVEPGSTTTVTFPAVAADSLGPGQYTPRVASATDSVRGTLTVEQPDSASFAVTILAGESTLAAPAGGQFEVVARVENVGDLAATQTVELLVDGQRADQTVELATGARTTVALPFEAQAGDDGATVRIRSDDDSANAALTVQTPATFEVSLAEIPETVTAGAELAVGYEVTNTGETAGTQQLTLRVDGDAVENATQTVPGGASVTGEFAYTPTEAPATLEIAVASDDAAASTTLAVEPRQPQPVLPEQFEFGAQVVDTTTSTEIGLSNSGAVPRTFSAIEVRGSDAFAVEDVPAELELGPGDLLRLTVSYAPETAGDDAGTLVLVDTDGTVAEQVNLSGTALPAEPSLRVTPDSVTFPAVTVGETVTETVTVENTGTAALTVTRLGLDRGEAFALAGDEADGEFTLDPGASREGTVSFTPDAERSHTDYLLVESNTPSVPDRTVALTSSDIRASVESNASTQTLNVSASASAGERVEIAFPTTPDDQQYRTNNVAVTTAVDSDLELNVTTSNETLDAVRETTNGTTAGFADNTTRLGNISASTNLDDEDLEQVEFTATIDRSQFETENTNASDISFYRFDEETLEWVKQNTTVLRTTETTATVQVVGDGFSEWTAAAARPEFSIDDTEVNVTTATVGEVVEIDVFVTNTGGTEGTYVAELLLNGEVVGEQTAIIDSQGQENFLFQRSIGEPGQYEVQVNNVFVATVNITESGAEVEEERPENESDGGSDDDMLLVAVPVVVVIVAVVGLGVFYFRRRETSGGES